MKAIASLLSLLFLPKALADGHLNFNRISFFPVCRQLDPSCRTDNETNSGVVTASKDGMTAIYGDAAVSLIRWV